MDNNAVRLYARNSRVAWRIIDGAAVIVTPDDGMVHRLNETGTWLWGEISEPLSAEQLASRMTAEFEVDADTALADVCEFLAALANRGIITTEAGR